MKVGSAFSGIGGCAQAAPDSWEHQFFCEIEKFPAAVLAHHYPDVPNLGDITKVDWSKYDCDLVIGGPPCQAFSIAGKRQSLDDPRGNLSLEFVRMIHAIGPVWAVIENVPDWLNTADNAFGSFLGGIVGSNPLPYIGRWPDAGMVAGPRGRAAWRIFDAQYFGLAQRRKRVFVVYNSGGGDPAKVLFERQGMSGNPAPRRETGERVADSLTVGANQYSGFCGEPVEAIAFNHQAGSNVSMACSEEIMSTLQSSQTPALALRGREGGGTAELSGDIATALRASTGGGDKQYVLAPISFGQAVKTTGYQGDRVVGDGDIFPTLPSDGANNGGGGGAMVCANMIVRRITEREAERLQGFPDDYTKIPWRGKPADDCPSGPRYKALGNSWPVPVVAWIFRRIQEQEQ